MENLLIFHISMTDDAKLIKNYVPTVEDLQMLEDLYKICQSNLSVEELKTQFFKSYIDVQTKFYNYYLTMLKKFSSKSSSYTFSEKLELISLEEAKNNKDLNKMILDFEKNDYIINRYNQDEIVTNQNNIIDSIKALKTKNTDQVDFVTFRLLPTLSKHFLFNDGIEFYRKLLDELRSNEELYIKLSRVVFVTPQFVHFIMKIFTKPSFNLLASTNNISQSDFAAVLLRTQQLTVEFHNLCPYLAICLFNRTSRSLGEKIVEQLINMICQHPEIYGINSYGNESVLKELVRYVFTSFESFWRENQSVTVKSQPDGFDILENKYIISTAEISAYNNQLNIKDKIVLDKLIIITEKPPETQEASDLASIFIKYFQKLPYFLQISSVPPNKTLYQIFEDIYTGLDTLSFQPGKEFNLAEVYVFENLPFDITEIEAEKQKLEESIIFELEILNNCKTYLEDWEYILQELTADNNKDEKKEKFFQYLMNNHILAACDKPLHDYIERNKWKLIKNALINVTESDSNLNMMLEDIENIISNNVADFVNIFTANISAEEKIKRSYTLRNLMQNEIIKSYPARGDNADYDMIMNYIIMLIINPPKLFTNYKFICKSDNIINDFINVFKDVEDQNGTFKDNTITKKLFAIK